MAQRNALGRGLGALINDAETITKIEKTSNPTEINISDIETNPNQPRSIFDEERLDELSSSIKELGIIQPITLRRKQNSDKYQLVSGERRLRASTIAGLKKIPAYIREVNDTELLEMALVENIQRENLNAIEIALSFNRLIEECKLTQQEMSERVGKKRSTITNYIRLLKLPPVIQKGIRNDELSMGHARALVNLPDEKTQIEVYKKIVKNNLSVREIEKIANQLNKPFIPKEEANNRNEEYSQIQQQISDLFEADIKFKRNVQGKGKIEILFSSDRELEKIISLFDKIKQLNL